MGNPKEKAIEYWGWKMGLNEEEDKWITLVEEEFDAFNYREEKRKQEKIK